MRVPATQWTNSLIDERYYGIIRWWYTVGCRGQLKGAGHESCILERSIVFLALLCLSSSLLLSCYGVNNKVLPCPPAIMLCPSQAPEQGRQPTALRMGCQHSLGSILLNLEWVIRGNLMVPGPQRAFQDISNHGRRTLAHGAQFFMLVDISICLIFNTSVA